MGCLRLNIIEQRFHLEKGNQIPSKRSSQIRMGSLSNWEPITKKGVSAYRFGFQGQENDNEISGNGNSYTAEYCQYDSRLGRRWNVDPVLKEWESPYSCFSNNAIYIIDKFGDDGKIYIYSESTTVNVGQTDGSTKPEERDLVGFSSLEKVAQRSTEIFQKQGIDLTVVAITKEQAESLELDPTDAVYRLASVVGGGYGNTPVNPNELENHYINMRSATSYAEVFRDFNYALGYLVAHEVVHRYLTNYLFFNIGMSVKEARGYGPSTISATGQMERGHNNSTTNLNNSGSVSQIPFKPSLELQNQEKILSIQKDAINSYLNVYNGKTMQEAQLIRAQNYKNSNSKPWPILYSN